MALQICSPVYREFHQNCPFRKNTGPSRIRISLLQENQIKYQLQNDRSLVSKSLHFSSGKWTDIALFYTIPF